MIIPSFPTTPEMIQDSKEHFTAALNLHHVYQNKEKCNFTRPAFEHPQTSASTDADCSIDKKKARALFNHILEHQHLKSKKTTKHVFQQNYEGTRIKCNRTMFSIRRSVQRNNFFHLEQATQLNITIHTNDRPIATEPSIYYYQQCSRLL